MSEGAAVSVKELRKIYSSRKASVPALDGVTFDVERGTIVGLLGPNGAGKTTLVKTLLALQQPTSGACEVLGREPDDHSNRRRIGYLPEQLKIPDYYKPQTFLRDMAALNGFRPSDLEARILRLIEIVGLSEALKKRVGDFSKGMQQRLCYMIRNCCCSTSRRTALIQ
jgi:ABC-2 type transport system ATP-binding protein